MMHIVVIGAPMLSSLIQNCEYVPPQDVTIRLIDTFLNDASDTAARIEKGGDVDVFVSAGAYARLVAQAVKKPVVQISVTGFDILKALNVARNYSDDVAVFAHPDQIAHLLPILGVLSIRVTPIPYDVDVTQIERRVDELLAAGVQTVIGAGLILEAARRRGMKGVFIYSDDSATRALNQAVQIALSNREEAERAKELQTILDFTHAA